MPREFVFVDAGIEDYRTLVESIGVRESTDRFELVILDPDRDGVEQMTEHLRGVTNLAAVHILSHGNNGKLQLGRASLSPSFAERLRQAVGCLEVGTGPRCRSAGVWL